MTQSLPMTCSDHYNKLVHYFTVWILPHLVQKDRISSLSFILMTFTGLLLHNLISCRIEQVENMCSNIVVQTQIAMI